jgi:hypothetical protein
MRSLAQLQQFWRGHGLESAFLAPAPSPNNAAGAPAAAGLHWVRPGVLCCAVVTTEAHLQVGVCCEAELCDWGVREDGLVGVVLAVLCLPAGQAGWLAGGTWLGHSASP